ncbi:MAG: NlpC/P60 family protein [Micromonosporaceae bacterium]
MTATLHTAPRSAAAALLTLGLVVTLVFSAPGGAAAEPSIEDMERKIEHLASNLGVVVEKYNRSRDELDSIKRKTRRLSKQIKPLQEEADKRYAAVGEISRMAYKGSRASAANALLNSGSPQTLVDQLLTLDRLADYEKKDLDGLERVKSRLDRRKASVDALLRKQLKIQKSLATRKSGIQGKIDKLQEMRRQAYGDRAARNGERVSYVPPYVPGRAGKVVRYAQAQLGKPYVFGASGPDSFDCSGLTLASWRSVGVQLPHSARQQYYETNRVSQADLSPGDIVFYYSDIHHNAVYIGDGWIIHAPEPGRTIEQVRYNKWPIAGYGRPD